MNEIESDSSQESKEEENNNDKFSLNAKKEDYDSEDEIEKFNYLENKLEKISFEKIASSGNKWEEELKNELQASLAEEKFIYNFKDMVLNQNIIEGNWPLNPQTKHLISLNQLLYDKIKNYVEKFYQKEDKENLIITILVIYCLKYNKDIELSEYILIINKGIEYLESKGVENICYKNIEPYLNNYLV